MLLVGAQSGHLSGDTLTAFENMWEEQETAGEDKGAWRWLRFKNEPWEADDSGLLRSGTRGRRRWNGT